MSTDIDPSTLKGKPYEYIDGIKTYICNKVGILRINRKVAKPGERVQMGDKTYYIHTDWSLRRIDKVRKK